ncbi:hypothetical protein B0T22DRAFT_443282 [Podospora appendiculata]|uniref:Alpha-xenorhabdolysin family binary toxin subunit A n=1 Tax=Podospora appendiculata TaxID=314037 RepID=A0AAE0X795_9PEZI|nr:hypothetical protein B0T22DRAFT_443282 [Podospora appendiculata]
MTTTWDPVTEAEQALKQAFGALSASPDTALVPATDTTPNRFILHTRGYYDLRAYVITGKDFPRTVAEFQTKMPKAAFAKLNSVDADIYTKTQNTMVAIGSSCATYHANNLAKLVTAATAAALFSDNTIGLLSDTPDINLKDQIDILLQPQYTTVASQDDVFRDAKEAAQFTLMMLKDEAAAKEEEVQGIIETMIAFKESTMQYLVGVQYLNTMYMTGPVTNAATDNQPYLSFMQAKLKADYDQLKQTIAEAQAKYSEWNDAKNMAIGMAFLGLPGWIYMGIKAAEADRLKQQADALNATVARLQRDAQEEAQLITFITQLTNQCDDIDDKMDTAIAAMVELAKLFNAQAACYDKIGLYIAGMYMGTDANSLRNRTTYIKTNMANCITKLRDLKSLAQEFAEGIIQNITLTGTLPM